MNFEMFYFTLGSMIFLYITSNRWKLQIQQNLLLVISTFNMENKKFGILYYQHHIATQNVPVSLH